MSDFEHQIIFPAAELFLIRRYMRAQDFSPRQWLLGTGLDENAISRPDTLVSSHQFDIVYRNVYRLVERPDVGLHFGLALNLSRWGMLAMALICARTLGAALETANAYRTLLRSRFNLHPEVDGSSVRITVTPRSGMTFPVTSSFAYEMLLGTLQSQISDLLGQSFSFQRIALQYSPPSHRHAYQRYCRCPVDFDAPATVLWVAKEDMERALPLANQVAELQARVVFEREIERVAQVESGDIAWLVRNELASNPVLPLPGLETMAQRLAMSPRTLRRRLNDAKTRYRSLCREHQLQLALNELAGTRQPISRVASSCGFRDVGSFRTVFKRWIGMTPREYRKQFGEGSQRW